VRGENGTLIMPIRGRGRSKRKKAETMVKRRGLNPNRGTRGNGVGYNKEGGKEM